MQASKSIESKNQMDKSAPAFHSIILLCLILITSQSVIGSDAPSSPSNPKPTRTALFGGLHPGVHIYRYDWYQEGCVLYVAEMDRSHTDLHFGSSNRQRSDLGQGNRQIYRKSTLAAR